MDSLLETITKEAKDLIPKTTFRYQLIVGIKILAGAMLITITAFIGGKEAIITAIKHQDNITVSRLNDLEHEVSLIKNTASSALEVATDTQSEQLRRTHPVSAAIKHERRIIEIENTINILLNKII